MSTELTYTLAELTADRVVFTGKNDSATTTETITVRPAGTGSEITYHAEIDIQGVIGTLAAPATFDLRVAPHYDYGQRRPEHRTGARLLRTDPDARGHR